MQVPRYWRTKDQRYALSGQTCLHCGAKLLAPRPVCPVCGGESVQREFPNQAEAISLPLVKESSVVFEKGS